MVNISCRLTLIVIWPSHYLWGWVCKVYDVSTWHFLVASNAPSPLISHSKITSFPLHFQNYCGEGSVAFKLILITPLSKRKSTSKAQLPILMSLTQCLIVIYILIHVHLQHNYIQSEIVMRKLIPYLPSSLRGVICSHTWNNLTWWYWSAKIFNFYLYLFFWPTITVRFRDLFFLSNNSAQL